MNIFLKGFGGLPTKSCDIPDIPMYDMVLIPWKSPHHNHFTHKSLAFWSQSGLHHIPNCNRTNEGLHMETSSHHISNPLEGFGRVWSVSRKSEMMQMKLLMLPAADWQGFLVTASNISFSEGNSN